MPPSFEPFGPSELASMRLAWQVMMDADLVLFTIQRAFDALAPRGDAFSSPRGDGDWLVAYG